MIDYRTFDEIYKICGWMEDEKSRTILKQRFLYSVSRNSRYIYEMLPLIGFTIDKLDGMYQRSIEKYDAQALFPREDMLTWLAKRGKGRIVIFGCGSSGTEMARQLRALGIPFFAFADNHKTGRYFGRSVIRAGEIPGDASILISSSVYCEEMLKQLLDLGYSRENIFIPGTNALWCPFGTSYFDNEIFQPADEEIFIDGGAFRGETSLEFAGWARSYQRIVAFEPDERNYHNLRRKIEAAKLKDIEMVHAGLWSGDGNLALTHAGDDGTSSCISEAGQERVAVKALDHAVNGRVSFIKLDIEGAELEALKGAQKTIRRDKPRMAVCIYHKPEDIWEIPRYIKSLVPEYHMAVRHYMTYLYDTILYCWL